LGEFGIVIGNGKAYGISVNGQKKYILLCLNTTMYLYLLPILFAHPSLSLSFLSANFLLLSKSPISKNWFIISLPNQVLLFYFCDLFYYSHNFFFDKLCLFNLLVFLIKHVY
jgi:hypothetical protein